MDRVQQKQDTAIMVIYNDHIHHSHVTMIIINLVDCHDDDQLVMASQ
jgi:hypothetical protein